MARGHTKEANECMSRRIVPGDLDSTMESAVLDSTMDSMGGHLLNRAPPKCIDGGVRRNG